MATGLHHPMLFVKNIDTMAAFYSAALGGDAQVGEVPGYLVIAIGELPVLALHALPDSIAEQVEVKSPPVRRGECASKLRFSAESLVSAQAAVQRAGGSCDPPFEWSGRHYADCVDPEGNVFQLVG